MFPFALPLKTVFYLSQIPELILQLVESELVGEFEQLGELLLLPGVDVLRVVG